MRLELAASRWSINKTKLEFSGSREKTKDVVDGQIEIKLLGEARVKQPAALELTMLNTLPDRTTTTKNKQNCNHHKLVQPDEQK